MARDVRLDWSGRTWTPGESPRPAPSARVIEHGADEARILFGDALDNAALLASRGVRAHLVYVDPPYASQTDYVAEARLDGAADGRTRRNVAFQDRWRGRDGVGAYLDMLAPRLEALAGLLRDDGTLWIHLDWRSAYLVRVVLDEVLGRERFKNEIVWRRAPNLGRQAASGQFGRTLDTLLVYGGEKAVLRPPTRLEPIDDRAVRFDDEGRAFTTAPRGDYTDASIAKLEKEGRVHRTASGRVYIKYFLVEDDAGKYFRERRVDALWTDVAPLRHAAPSERTGYPTQKPRALLDRIVRCATPEGGLVVDLFGGSGTTAEAAVALGRRAITGDIGSVAIATSRARLLRLGVGPTIEAVGGAALPASAARASLDWHSAGLRVILHEPSLPMAWAVDAHGKPDAPFHPSWHAERSLGAGPARLPPYADLEAPKGPLRIRAFCDDGALAETTLDVTPAPRAALR
ncbi:MAG TPA: site-specific DNA-methyltransferase [Polyangiaceae bacterium]|nr:site-specific DNA-methyltransferase [Polyangiaceae bacterium]